MKRKRAKYILCLLLCILCICGQVVLAEKNLGKAVYLRNNTAIKLNNVRLLTESIRKYEKLEMELNITGYRGNPFNPDEIDITTEFISPSGQMMYMPAFWYQDYERSLSSRNKETLVKKGEPGWRVRFTPTEKGVWQYTVLVKTQGGIIVKWTDSFEVKDSSGKGFIKVDPVRKRNFVFDNGELYIPVGQNVSWWSSFSGKASYDYDIWYTKMANSGANFSRVWMADWGFGLVWKDTGLIDYSKRLDRAYLLDKNLELAEETGIYIMLTILHHGPFSTRVNPQWDDNPYNIENGGFLVEPRDFFSDIRAIKQFKKRLRYIVARWGYSPHIMSWELWNEVHYMDYYDQFLSREWHKEMATYLKEIDPYDHLVSTSSRDTDPVYGLEEIDFVNIHHYNFVKVPEVIGAKQLELLKQYQKPVLIAEFAATQSGRDLRTLDPEGISLHQGLWAGLMAGGAGTAMTWYWDEYVEPMDLYNHFKPVSIFSQKLVLDRKDIKPILPEDIGIKHSRIGAYGYQGDDAAYIWIYDKAHTFRTPKETRFRNLELTIGLKKGRYLIEFLNTYQGNIISRVEVKNTTGKLIVSVPEWSRDIALVISPVE